jgi:DNA-binding NtrC family response regulator
MVHGIVRELGGLIKMASGEGKGTTFRIYFPVFKADVNQQEKEMEPARRANLPTGNERIMVIDDEKSIAELLCSILGGLGYKVNSLIDSKKALADFSNNSSGYDLILTDQTMPGLTGSELACEILKIRPDMPIILCTGHSDYIGQEQATRIGIKEFMMKPIGISDLAESVRKVLDNTKAG